MIFFPVFWVRVQMGRVCFFFFFNGVLRDAIAQFHSDETHNESSLEDLRLVTDSNVSCSNVQRSIILLPVARSICSICGFPKIGVPFASFNLDI